MGTIAAANPKLLSKILLAAISAASAVIGVLYAAYTPAWQVPDEPAHYNYVRQLAEGQRLPVMEDYDQDYLELVKSKKFPADLSIDSVTYDDHQPPLYYLLGPRFTHLPATRCCRCGCFRWPSESCWWWSSSRLCKRFFPRGPRSR